MIGHEESHELWSIEDWDGSGSVNIEVSPGFGPVGVEVVNLSGTSDVLVGGKDLLSESSGRGFREGENSSWDTFFSGMLLSIVLDN